MKTNLSKIENLSELKVFLLATDRKRAANVSKSLKELNIYCEYFESLDDIWEVLELDRPDLLLVSVDTLSSGQTLLKDHVRYKLGELRIIYLYDRLLAPLVSSVLHTDYVSLLNLELPLRDQFSKILKEISHFSRLENELTLLHEKIDRTKESRSNQAKTIAQFEQKNKQIELYKSLVRFLTPTHDRKNFYKQIELMLKDWRYCDEFCFLELSASKKQLVSIKMTSEKYKEIEPFWVSESQVSDINSYAFEMALEMVDFTFKSEFVVPLRISGLNNKVHSLLILGFSKKQEQFPFDLMEKSLSYAFTLQKEELSLSQSPRSFDMSVSELYQILDEFEDLENPFYRAILIDHSVVKHESNKRVDLRFKWNDYHKDLSSYLQESLSEVDAHFCFVSQDFSILLLERKKLDESYQKVSSLLKGFSLIDYFSYQDFITHEVLSLKHEFISPFSEVIRDKLSSFHLKNDSLAKSEKFQRSLHRPAHFYKDLNS